MGVKSLAKLLHGIAAIVLLPHHPFYLAKRPAVTLN